MTQDQSQRLYEMISAALGGPEQSMFLLVAFDADHFQYPQIITDVPEEYIKRLVHKIDHDLHCEDRVQFRQGDEIAFRLEAKPRRNQQTEN